MTHGGARFTAGGAGGRARFRGHLLRVRRCRRSGTVPAERRVRFNTGGGAQPNLEDILGQMFGGGAPGAATAATARPQAPARGRRPGERASASATRSRAPRSRSARPTSGASTPASLRGQGRSADPSARQGPSGRPGAAPGDLILTVAVDKHPVFGREGDNLTLDLPVTFAEAALGATVAVPTLDGSTVKVKVAPGTPSGRVLRLKGRGVKRGDHVGDLLAKVQVVVPQRLTDEARDAVEKMAEAEAGHDPRADLFERARA